MLINDNKFQIKIISEAIPNNPNNVVKTPMIASFIFKILVEMMGKNWDFFKINLV